jgi:hypothetical protein
VPECTRVSRVFAGSRYRTWNRDFLKGPLFSLYTIHSVQITKSFFTFCVKKGIAVEVSGAQKALVLLAVRAMLAEGRYPNCRMTKEMLVVEPSTTRKRVHSMPIRGGIRFLLESTTDALACASCSSCPNPQSAMAKCAWYRGARGGRSGRGFLRLARILLPRRLRPALR